MPDPLPHVACPTCRRRGPWLESPSKPFCSERCRRIDLGAWFMERHAISEPLRPDHFADHAEASGYDLDDPTAPRASDETSA